MKEKQKLSEYLCDRCGVVTINTWPCLTAADARECTIAKECGVKPKLRLIRR